ncbi:hypothetical protein M8C21_030209, partial [Ambrosia artemisiifolia]
KHTNPSIYQSLYTPQHQQQLHSTNSRITYPVASSGRGFIPKHNQHSDQGLLSNLDGVPPRPVSGYPYVMQRSFGSNSDGSGHQLGNPASAHLHQSVAGAAGGSGSANPKLYHPNNFFYDIYYILDFLVVLLLVVGQSSVAADNSLKSIRDKNGDDTFVIIRDRKVQVSEGTSLYAQCRSWLKNGLILEKLPQYPDHVKSLPKPLPASVVEPRTDDEMEVEEKTEDVEHLSAKELLQQHVKHAKKTKKPEAAKNRAVQRSSGPTIAPCRGPTAKNRPAFLKLSSINKSFVY